MGTRIILDNKNTFTFVKFKKKSYLCRTDVFIEIHDYTRFIHAEQMSLQNFTLYEKRIDTTGEESIGSKFGVEMLIGALVIELSVKARKTSVV